MVPCPCWSTVHSGGFCWIYISSSLLNVGENTNTLVVSSLPLVATPLAALHLPHRTLVGGRKRQKRPSLPQPRQCVAHLSESRWLRSLCPHCSGPRTVPRFYPMRQRESLPAGGCEGSRKVSAFLKRDSCRRKPFLGLCIWLYVEETAGAFIALCQILRTAHMPRLAGQRGEPVMTSQRLEWTHPKNVPLQTSSPR